MTDLDTANWTEERHPNWGLTIRWTPFKHAFLDDGHVSSVDFCAKEWAGDGDDGPIYDTDDNSAMNCVDFDKGNAYVYGYLKWDGCSHLHFGQKGDDGYLHLCGGEQFEKLAFVLKRFTEIALACLTSPDPVCRFPARITIEQPEKQ